jgi:MOSC domain-containing protein YiiM
MTGRLLGIARQARPDAMVETVDHVHVSTVTGVAGDFHGAVMPGQSSKRQVTVMTWADWQAAMAELGQPPVVWSARQANLLVDGIVLPRDEGAMVRIGGALLEITGEWDPDDRLDDVAPGLKAALLPNGRGGRTMRVIEGGHIAVGDLVSIKG